MGTFALLLAALFLHAPPGFTSPIVASSFAIIPPTEFARGRWALLFVVLPGCPACEQALSRLSGAGQAFPTIRAAVAAPDLTPELAAAIEADAPGVPVVRDPGGALGRGFGVRQAPTVILLVAGRPVGRLDWPFAEEDLARRADAIPRDPDRARPRGEARPRDRCPRLALEVGDLC